MRRRNVILCALSAGFSSLSAAQYPSEPIAPTVAEPQVDAVAKPTRNKKNTPPAKAVPVSNLRLRIHLGDKSILLAEATLPATYSFTHKKGQVQYNQTVRIEDVRELVIENYRARKVSSGKDGDVFEFEPAQVRIELKDGQSFRLQYLFKELRKIRARNADGSFSVFAFFADTYKTRSGWQERAGEDFLMQTRRTHPAAYTKLEYFEPVDKTGGGDAAEKEPGVQNK